MKTLGLIMSLLLGMIFLPAAQGQGSYYDNDYYYNNSRNKTKKHYKSNKKQYKNNQKNYNIRTYYRNDNLSIRSFERRIQKGVRSGELTRKETRKIKHELERLIRYENKVYRNGHVSRRESKKLRNMQISLDKMIYNAKHNRRHRH